MLIAALLVAGSVGCGPQEQSEADALATQEQEVTFVNGVVLNGVVLNGVVLNGVVLNGLTDLEMTSSNFKNWFTSDESRHATVMSYIVRCAVPAGQTRKFTSPTTGTTYSWTGELGLAHGWANGMAASVAEQQVVTACLGAHVNRFGVHVEVSLLGQNASGAPIAVSSSELATYSEPEGCFFGNSFGSSSAFYAGSDHADLSATQSSARACAMTYASGVTAPECAPIVNVGKCSQYCTKDSSGTYYTSCTLNGVSYKPLTTRIRPSEIVRCGDGVCQVSEKCGSSNTYNSCQSDCGSC